MRREVNRCPSRKWIVIIAVAFVAVLSVTGAALATKGTTKAPAKPAAHVVAKSLAAQTSTSTSSSSEATASESESSGESGGGTEPPGEPVPGHEDPDGVDVNHDCSPENPGGCDTANGELP